MKYLVILLALTLTACSKPKPKSYVCVNPFMALQGLEVDTDSPNVTDHLSYLELRADTATLVMPKSLCAEIKKKGE